MRHRYVIAMEPQDASPQQHLRALAQALGRADLAPGDREHQIRVLDKIGVVFAELTEEEAARVSGSPAVADVAPDEEAAILWDEAPVPTGHAFSSGWNVQLVRAPEVWRKTSGKDVRVGVFDTGIAPHMGYRDRLDPGASFVPGSPDTDDRKGVGHGTRCAGIIAARLPRWGLMGVAPDCRLVPIQILRSTGTTTAEWIIEAMHWASGQNLDVASLSFGGVNPLAPSINLAYERVIRLLIDQDCVLVAAAGNSGRSPSSFWVRRPASFKEVIAVGAVDARGELDERSSYTPVAGREEGVELVAPGMQVPTTKSEPTDTGLEYHSGTSAACPHVAGAAALLKQLEPGIKPAEARKVLIDSAADVHLDGHDVRTGFGLLDCAAAVSRL